MAYRRDPKDEPWVKNYKPLWDWLVAHEARCVHQLPVGRALRPEAYVEAWQMPGASGLVWLMVRSNNMGWDVMTGLPTNSIEETLQDAERRMGLAK